MPATRFDELTKTLAGTTTRRQALRAITVFTVGGLVGVRATGTAYAGGGNSACAHFCAQVFGADTPAAGQCTSQAAHGTGLCYQCGPAAPANHPLLCGQACCSAPPANAAATCTNGVCGFTCNAGYQLCGGTCIPSTDCCGGCTSPLTCQNGQCVCVSPPPPPTGPDSLTCTCQDGTQVTVCASLDCFSSAAQDAICGPACQCHGGEKGTGCTTGGCSS